MPLIIRLGGGHTDINTYTHVVEKTNFYKQACAGLWLACAWFKKHAVTHMNAYMHTHTHVRTHTHTYIHTYIH